ncbi:MAG: N-6 DNA methylase [Schaalia odontolytica]|nr:N-6 DNA methylase [Schaalia odontolytica]MDU5762345.1 N-6 DNA methylase [Schaalia odontolytica]
MFDPACGSGGMFVQCAKFVECHHEKASRKLSLFGTEKTGDTIPLAKMNLPLHGLSGDIRQDNSYSEDPYKADNGNFIWIQQFYAALSAKGRAGFVMANSACDTGHSEKDIRQRLIESGTVDVMVAVGPNFFYTVTLPVTLWFLDKAKLGTAREDTVLFIDARHVFYQIDRAHRDFTAEQIEFISNIVRLYRGEHVQTVDGSNELLEQNFPGGQYVDVGGLCKIATRVEIQEQGWSLNPGRYIGTAAVDEEDVDFLSDLQRLYEEFTQLSDDADALRAKVDAAINGVLGL